jgi:hypothetical protein
MSMTQYAKFVLTLGILLLFGVGTLPAYGDCPDDICDCIGAAGDFSLVASQAKIRQGIISASGYGEPVATLVETSLCALVGKVGGKIGGETQIEEDAIFAATSDVAVKFSGSKYYGYAYPGAYINGDVATGGGSIKGASFAEIGGVTDTSGNHPFVPDCTQALTDSVAGSNMIAALAPTTQLGDLVITDGASYDINVGSGEVSVIEVGKFIIKPLKMYGYPYPSTININLDGTNSVIINVTEKLAIGSACQILVNGGDIEDVIINVAGTGPSVRIARDAYVTAPILAPQRKIVASANSYCSNLFAGKLIIKGATISETMFCP